MMTSGGAFMKQKFAAMLLASTLAVTASACDGPSSYADVDVRFATDLTGTVASVLGDQAGALAPIALSAIQSIDVTITGVDAIRTEGEEGYIQLTLAEGAEGRINLLALPLDGGGADVGVQLARGTVPAGTYTGIRLRYDVATASITLVEEVTVGNQTFAAGTHTLDIPSGPQTGIKVPFASLTLAGEDAGNVVLTFDADATIQHVTGTGSGKLALVPVLQVRASVED
jgi:hypothetical protein